MLQITLFYECCNGTELPEADSRRETTGDNGRRTGDGRETDGRRRGKNDPFRRITLGIAAGDKTEQEKFSKKIHKETSFSTPWGEFFCLPLRVPLFYPTVGTISSVSRVRLPSSPVVSRRLPS